VRSSAKLPGRSRAVAIGRVGSALAVAGLLAVSGSDAGAATLCGRVESGGHPIRGASVLAADEGRVAHTDTTGLFCLQKLRGKTQRLQILALGFAPVERFLPAGTETLFVELVPLRTLSSAHMAPAKNPQPSRDVTKEVPEFPLPSSSSEAPFGVRSSTLRTQLSDSAFADSVTRNGSWQDVAARVAEAQQAECSEAGGGGAVCAYLLQAEAVAWARAAVVEADTKAGQRARDALARLSEHHESSEFRAWAARLEGLLPH
jgi:hypothetical protein